MLADLRERVTSVLMRIELRPDRPPPSPEPVRVHGHAPSRPGMAELEMAGEGGRRLRAVPMATGDAAPGRGGGPERSRHLAPHPAQRPLPLRLRQEVQALPRPGLSPASGSDWSAHS